jgi:hypothetical protein
VTHFASELKDDVDQRPPIGALTARLVDGAGEFLVDDLLHVFRWALARSVAKRLGLWRDED